MKMKAIVVLFLMTFVYAIAEAAPSRAGRVDVGVNLSAAIPQEEGADTSLYGGGNFSYGITDWLAVGMSSGYASFGTDAGDLNAVPVLGEIIFRVPTSQSIQPYGVVGLGGIFWDFQENDLLKTFNVKGSVDDSFAVKLGGGADCFLNEHWILNFEFSYLFSDANVTFKNTVTGASVNLGDVNTDAWFVGGGLKYLF